MLAEENIWGQDRNGNVIAPQKPRPIGAWTGHPRDLTWEMEIIIPYVYLAANWICK
jgi:hypothetical protein